METEEDGLNKIWLKLVHAYTADTRLFFSSPPRAFGEPGNEFRNNSYVICFEKIDNLQQNIKSSNGDRKSGRRLFSKLFLNYYLLSTFLLNFADIRQSFHFHFDANTIPPLRKVV